MSLALLVSLSTGASPAAATVLVPATDLDTLEPLGTKIGPDLTTDFMTGDLTVQGGPPPMEVGKLTGRVWLHGGTYTYELVVTPQGIPTEFNTGFTVHGFDPAVHAAGFSFSDAAAAGALPGMPVFYILLESDRSIDWNVKLTQLLYGFWQSGSIRFFFQSSRPPGLSSYNLIASEGGYATNYAPIAAPVCAGNAGAGNLTSSASTRPISFLAAASGAGSSGEPGMFRVATVHAQATCADALP